VRHSLIFSLTVLCASFLAASGLGQETGVAQAVLSAQRPQAGTMTINYSGSGPRRIGPAVTGVPYSAEQVTDTVQTLADGTHIRQNQRTMIMYRDSAGRTRTEMPAFGPSMSDGAKIVRIVDVVGGYEYTLDDQNKIAHRIVVQPAEPMPKTVSTGAPGAGTLQWFNTQVFSVPGPVPTAQVMPMPLPRVVPPGGAGDAPRPEMHSEDLGMQMIEGVNARGHRTTQTWPVDSVGNDRPIVVVFENWFSDQLGTTVLMKNNDPRHGETTTALKNVSLAEPDPSLFQPPPGYQIVDDNGPFQITVPRPGASPTRK